MSSPLASCIVPAFNSERYVRAALESILAQTYRPIEVIVADGGSSDGTTNVVRQYAGRVELVQEAGAGPAATRNLGLRTARGDFIAFLDADDLWRPEKLSRQMARFEARPELDLCIAHVQLFWSAELSAEARFYEGQQRAEPIAGYATTSLLARKSVFDRIGGFDEALWFADATDWFVRAAERGLVLEVMPEVLTEHRMHSSNLTRRRSDASREEFLNLVKAALDRRRVGSGR